MTVKDLVVAKSAELESRPLALIVQTANKFKSKIYFENKERKVNAKSIMGMMTITLVEGTAIKVYTDGPDEDEAMAEIEKLLS